MSKRDDQIIELVHKYGELSVQELSDLLEISSLNCPSRPGLCGEIRYIERTHGGVTLATGSIIIIYVLTALRSIRVDHQYCLTSCGYDPPR